MKKSDFKAMFRSAKLTDSRYIGIKIETEGSRQPEVVIIQKEDFDEKLKNYMDAYDGEMVMEIAKWNKNIPLSEITDIAKGQTFKDIEYQLMSVGYGWKKPISEAIDKTYRKMMAENPPESKEEQIRRETMKEAIKGMFLNESRREIEARFIFDNIEKYEEIFEICMNGSDMQFREGIVELQRMQNEYILKEEKMDIKDMESKKVEV